MDYHLVRGSAVGSFRLPRGWLPGTSILRRRDIGPVVLSSAWLLRFHDQGFKPREQQIHPAGSHLLLA
jgi:hypothetical protein